MLSNLRNTLLAGLASLVLAAGAQAAAIITLENPAAVVYKQTANSPCIFDNNSCSNPDGLRCATLIPNAASYTNLMSPVYTAEQIADVLGLTTFFIGIDVNTTGNQDPGGGPETLNLFQMLVNDVVVAEFNTPTLLKLNQNAGNGESDDLLMSDGVQPGSLQPGPTRSSST